MNKFFTLLLAVAFAPAVKAQTPVTQDQPYGKIDTADLKMTSCDFEKDANAEVLLDISNIYYSEDLNAIVNEVHRRIKIFNSNGNSAADIRISYISYHKNENVTSIEAETINLVDGKPEITKIDKKQIYNVAVDQQRNDITFTLPNIKPGCIIEFKYKSTTLYNASIPTFYFQETIPVRYSEIKTAIPDLFYFRPQLRIYQALAKHTTSVDVQTLKVTSHTYRAAGSDQQSDTYNYNDRNEVWGMANIPSLRSDAYISSFADNAQRLSLDLVSYKPIGGLNTTNIAGTWARVGGDLADDEDFGSQLNRSLNDEDMIIGKAALLKSNDEKIAFVFNEVKNAMKWDGKDRWHTVDGTHKAWENKSGNSTEINLCLYHLLKQLKIEAYPMVVSTRANGRPDPWRTSIWQFNRAVVYVPVDSTKQYILDATGKYNLYNETPPELLNSFGLWINKSKKTYDTVSINKALPVRQVVLINAEIKPGGKLEGTAQINSASYDRVNAIERYKRDGEEKYKNYLRNDDNNIKISSLKFENMEVDSLPLTQNIAFNLDLAGSDENYIYLNPNLFTPLKTNPFLSESRLTDIYFGYLRNYSINSVYKLPAGYKVDALPKSVNMIMPDKSISFKRIVAEQDGSVLVHFIINYTRTAFNASEYPGIHDFYKKMYEMLNEQIVLKKI
ncbi:MAG TPA: DUF3857 domain-containing protein [Mucilaginibacter sp.]|jgi:hypothetical protein